MTCRLATWFHASAPRLLQLSASKFRLLIHVFKVSEVSVLLHLGLLFLSRYLLRRLANLDLRVYHLDTFFVIFRLDLIELILLLSVLLSHIGLQLSSESIQLLSLVSKLCNYLTRNFDDVFTFSFDFGPAFQNVCNY